MRVDTTAPSIRLVRVFPRVLSPDSDGNRDRVTASYRIDERARAVMLVDGRQRVQSKFRRVEGNLVWFGRVNGRVVRSGLYEIRLRAVDRAGNRSARTRAVPVRVRFVELSRERIEVGAAKRFSVRVLTDASSYRWLLRRAPRGREPGGARAARARGARHLHAVRDGRGASGARRRGRHGAGGVTQPLILLGVSRSGTTLLRVILDRSRGIAIPDESFFVPLLARRHGRTIDAERFLDDVARIPTIRDWGVSVERAWRHACARGCRPERRSQRSSRRTRPQPRSRAGATRRRCTCGISSCFTSCSPTRSTST